MAARVSDKIAEAAGLRGELVAELQELLDRAEAEGRSLSDIEQRRFDKLKKAIEEGDQHLDNLRVAENVVARTATRIGPAREAPVLEKGIGIARYVQLLLGSRGNDGMAIELAKRHFPDMAPLASIFQARAAGVLQRAAVPPANTTDPAWAGTLVYVRQLSNELIELVMPETVLGQLQGLRRVPFNVRIPRETQLIAQARWVGQGQSKPVGRGAFDFITVPYTKAALIVLLTEELARFSDPSAEMLIRNGLVRHISQFLDTEFLSTSAAVPGVSPGGILAGLPAGQQFPSSGSGWENILWDTVNAVNLLDSGLTAARRPVWIMSRANKTAIGFLPNAFGVSAFPTVAGQGRLADIPVITSQNMPNNIVLLVDADMLLYASDPDIRLDISREASVQLDTDPSTPPTGMVSLWQQNLIGILAEKYEWWGRARDQAIVEITGVSWSTAPPPPALITPGSAPLNAAAVGHGHAARAR